MYAFGSPNGRFRFVVSLASADGVVGECPAIEPPEGWAEQNKSGLYWEWFQLVGTRELLDGYGIDRTLQHRHGSSHMYEEMNIREAFKDDSELRRRRWDLLVTQEIISLLDPINEICEKLNFDPRVIFLCGVLGRIPQESTHNLIASLPSALTWATMRDWKHRDFSHPWEQLDWAGISVPSVAVPYCDIVVTERRWAHIIRASGLATRFDTDVGYGLQAIETLVSRVSSR